MCEDWGPGRSRREKFEASEAGGCFQEEEGRRREKGLHVREGAGKSSSVRGVGGGKRDTYTVMCSSLPEPWKSAENFTVSAHLGIGSPGHSAWSLHGL